MTDEKPPRLAGDERATLMALLQYQRESFVRKVSGVGETEARRSPVSSGTSLLWLTHHMADAERTWILERFARRAMGDTAGHRGGTGHGGGITDAIGRYRRVWNEVDGVLEAVPSLDQKCPPFDEGPDVSLRWILAHLLEETARHAGHADILREILDGTTGR